MIAIRRTSVFAFLLPVLAVFALCGAARAQEEAAPPSHVRLTLTPEFSTVKAGETLFVAIRQDLDEGWHSYWRNAGDSGEPPQISWTMPDGFAAGVIRWPVPERIATGPLTSYGYEGSVTLLQELRAPDPLPDGALRFEAAVDILVCSDICIPEYHTLSFTLNDGDGTAARSEAIDTAYAAMPVDVDWQATYGTDEDGDFEVDLSVEMPALIAGGERRLRFDVLPYEWGIVDNSAPTRVRAEDGFKRLVMKRKSGDRKLGALGPLTMLAVYEDMDSGAGGALEIVARPREDEAGAGSAAVPDGSGAGPDEGGTMRTGFGLALLLALLGGLILNLMPCVFPILSMKALALAAMAEKSSGTARAHGGAYTGGVLAGFAFLAVLLIVLQAGGAQIGWGFQLQSPPVVLALCYLLFLIGLNLSGFFEIGAGLANIGAGFGRGGGLAGSFFTGLLAAVVATPCTAPFMGVALGYALTHGAAAALPVFLALGFGLALPYLLLSFFPALRAMLPKPGPWMVVFREFLAFPMYGSALWLVWVYGEQTGPAALLYALCGFIGIGFAVWVLRKAPAAGKGRTAMLALAAASLLTVPLTAARSTVEAQSCAAGAAAAEAGWLEPYSAPRYQALIDGDRPVFVNMTADWCITCKVNERAALNTSATRALFGEREVGYLKGDWTSGNPAITAYLKKYGRNGVPLYVFYGARDPATGKRPEPVVLPQILTPGIVAAVIEGEKT